MAHKNVYFLPHFSGLAKQQHSWNDASYAKFKLEVNFNDLWMEKIESSRLQQQQKWLSTAQGCTEMTVPGRTTAAPECAMQHHSIAPIIKLPYTLLRSNCNRITGQRSRLKFLLSRGSSKSLCIVQNGYLHVRLPITWVFVHHASLLSALL